MPDTNFDFSVRNVPDSWNDAAKDGPQGEPGPLIDRRIGNRRLPSGMKPDLIVGALAGLFASIVFGTFWIWLNLQAIYTGPFMAVLFGLVVAVAVRFGAGRAGAELRVSVGALLYVAGVLVCNFFIIRQVQIGLYGRTPAFSDIEGRLGGMITDPITASVWLLGFAVMCWASFRLQFRRR